MKKYLYLLAAILTPGPMVFAMAPDNTAGKKSYSEIFKNAKPGVSAIIATITIAAANDHIDEGDSAKTALNSLVSAPAASASIPATIKTSSDSKIITTRFDHNSILFFTNPWLALKRNSHLKDQNNQTKMAYHRLPLNLEQDYGPYATAYSYKGNPCLCWPGYVIETGCDKPHYGVFESTFSKTTGKIFHRCFNGNGINKYPKAIQTAYKAAIKLHLSYARYLALNQTISNYNGSTLYCQNIPFKYNVTQCPTVDIYETEGATYGILKSHKLINNNNGTFTDTVTNVTHLP